MDILCIYDNILLYINCNGINCWVNAALIKPLFPLVFPVGAALYYCKSKYLQYTPAEQLARYQDVLTGTCGEHKRR